MTSRWFSYRFLPYVLRIVCASLLLFVLAAWAPVASLDEGGQVSTGPTTPTIYQIGLQRPTLSATISGGRITLRGSNYRPNHVFFVKVGGRQGGNWTRVGTIRPNSNGTISSTVRLPNSLRNAPRVRVCLKEIYRGYTVCTTAKRTF